MRILTASALLLDVVDLRERDVIVTFLTAEWGKKQGVARGARAKYSRFAGHLQPLSKVRMTWFEKAQQDLVRISEIGPERSVKVLHDTLEGLLLSCYLAEHMVKFAQENEASDHLFRLLDTTVEALCGGVDNTLAARYYEVWMLRLAGIFPVASLCPLCGRVLEGNASLFDGALICTACARQEQVPAKERLHIGGEELEFLRRSGRENLPRLAQDPPNPGALRRIEKLCGRVRRDFLQHELKSYDVMQRTLADL